MGHQDLDQELGNPQAHLDLRLCFSLYFHPPPLAPRLVFPASLYLAAFIEPQFKPYTGPHWPWVTGSRFPGPIHPNASQVNTY